jgi:hypothetical protein
VNILVVSLFYWRYQKGYPARLAAAGTADRLPGVYPVKAGSVPTVSTRASEVSDA